MIDSLRNIAHEEQKLYIPGQGFVDLHLRRAMKVVKDYDERLILAKHEHTGDWVAFIQLGPDRMFPVIGFGKELLHPDEIRRILEQADTHRHGDRILRQIQEHNDRLQRAARAHTTEAIEEAAERADFGFRKYMGLKPQIFIP